MPLLKNESNSPSSPLAPSLFPANLSAPLSSDGFTGAGRDGSGEKNKRRALHSQTNLHLCRGGGGGEKALLVPLF